MSVVDFLNQLTVPGATVVSVVAVCVAAVIIALLSLF